jgi:uncharacterized membrane protein
VSHLGKSRPFGCRLRVTACAVIAAIGLAHGAFAATAGKHRAAARTAKCLCGYGVSGYDNINCVPVKDCEWEHATCRGAC